MSDLASLRQSPKRPLASETDSEQVDVTDDLLRMWCATPAPPPDPRYILIKETLREIKRAKFADGAPKSVADENRYNKDEAAIRLMSSLRKQRDEALTKVQNIDGITSECLFHDLVDIDADDDSFDESLNYAHAMIDELTSKECQDRFYIGICCSPYLRFKGCGYMGHEKKWRVMHLLISCNGPVSARLEKALLATWKQHARCTNVASGGQGAGPRDSVAFVYCCIGELCEPFS